VLRRRAEPAYLRVVREDALRELHESWVREIAGLEMDARPAISKRE